MSSPEDEFEIRRRRRQLQRAAETLSLVERRIALLRSGPVPSAEDCARVELIVRTAYFSLTDWLEPKTPRPVPTVQVPTVTFR